MARTQINADFYLPMPVTLVGTKVKGKPNFCAVGWITRVNYKPAMIGIALYKTHHSPIGIKENKTFSVCIPGADLAKEADYCGIVSGKKADKYKLFTIFYGKTKTAPMIKECPINIECKIYKIIDLPDDYLFIGKVIGVYADQKCLDNGKIDYKKIKPFIYTIPDNIYSLLGKKIGDAHSTRLAEVSAKRVGRVLGKKH
jgi:flavin reductase (DIM6/NTAB) family NADH-FMN oxidoreductase RutF